MILLKGVKLTEQVGDFEVEIFEGTTLEPVFDLVRRGTAVTRFKIGNYDAIQRSFFMRVFSHMGGTKYVGRWVSNLTAKGLGAWGGDNAQLTLTAQRAVGARLDILGQFLGLSKSNAIGFFSEAETSQVLNVNFLLRAMGNNIARNLGEETESDPQYRALARERGELI